jgi:replicative DNA helicase
MPVHPDDTRTPEAIDRALDRLRYQSKMASPERRGSIESQIRALLTVKEGMRPTDPGTHGQNRQNPAPTLGSVDLVNGSEGAGDFYAVILGNRRGVLCAAFGRRPHRTPKGRYEHEEWREWCFTDWPTDRQEFEDRVVRELETGEPVDIYICPALRHGNARRRRQGDALPPTTLWADMDGLPADPVLYAALLDLGAWPVRSGSGDHRHLYLPLTRPVDLGTFNRLNSTLAEKLKADAKWADNSLLRAPGSYNWKLTTPAAGEPAGPPVLVEVEAWNGLRVDPDELAELLGVDVRLSASSSTKTTSTTATSGTGADKLAAEPVPVMPSSVLSALAHPDTADRSVACARVIGSCVDAGLTPGQTLTIITGYGPAERYKNVKQMVDDVVRFHGKATADRDAKAEHDAATWARLGFQVPAVGTTADPGTQGQNRQNPLHVPAPPGSVDSVNASPPPQSETPVGSVDSVNALGAPWPELPMSLGEVPDPLPTDALGGVLGPLAEGIAASYQVPSDLVVNLALPLITTAIGGRWTVQVTPDWTEVLALATLSALASGERKSPVQRTLAAPLLAHERDAQREASFRIAQQVAKRKIAEDRAENLRKVAVKTGTRDDEEMYIDACLRLQDTIVDPMPRWIVDDTTPEALAALLAAHGSVGAVSAEPGLFSILAGRYSNGPNVEVVLKATSGDPFVVDRVGRDPLRVDRPALSISMCVQPGRLGELGGREKAFRASGLLARLLYALPAPRVGTRTTASPEVSQHLLDAWSAALEKLLAATPVQPVLTLDADALATLNRHRAWLEPQLDPRGGRLAGIGDWGSKLPGTIARIAASLALLADPNRTSIDAATMQNAVDLGQAYISHALAAFAVIHAPDDRLERARQTLAWLRKHGQQVVTLRELHRALQGRAWVDSADDVRGALAVLAQHGYIRLLPDQRQPGQPGRPVERYELHPDCLT